MYYQRTTQRIGRGHRDRVDIMADILILLDRKAQRRTQVMYLTNLSHEMLTSYLGELLESELISPNGPYYIITEKGKRFLGHYKDMKGVLTESNADKKILGMAWLQ